MATLAEQPEMVWERTVLSMPKSCQGLLQYTDYICAQKRKMTKEENFMALFKTTLPDNFYGTKSYCLWILIPDWPLQPRVWLIILHGQRNLIRKLTPIKMLRDGCIGKEMLNGEAASPGGDLMLLVSSPHCFLLELDIIFVFWILLFFSYLKTVVTVRPRIIYS